MVIASGAWIFHVAAMSVAPLSVVQAVLAGGVVLLAIMAERVLGVRVGRRQWLGLALTAAGLMLLGFTLPAVHGAHSRFSVPGMIAFEFVLLGAGTLLIMGPRIGAPGPPPRVHARRRGRNPVRRLRRGDQGAISGMVGAHGVAGLLSPWLLVTLAASVAAFYASAKGLQDGDAVPVIAITGTAANVAGIVGGIIVFGDPLAGNPVSLIIQVLAFGLVLTAAWLMPAPARGVPALAVA